jgi:hypothetical protein
MIRKMTLAMMLAGGIIYAQDACRRPLDDLDSIYKAGGGKGLVDYAAQVEAWHRTDTPLCYATLSLEMAHLFAEDGRSDDQMRQLEQHYAELGLSVADKIPVTLELYLVEHLRLRPVVTDDEVGWHRAALWAHAWHRIEAETITDFNFDDLPLINVAPPHGPSPMAAGMAPERISDPRQRAVYEEAIAENKKKTEVSNTQLILRRITPKFIVELEHYFVESFGSSEIGAVVGLLSPIRNPEKERIIQRIAEHSRMAPQ